MERWQRRTLGIISLGGGVTGLLWVVSAMSPESSLELWISAGLAILLFGAGVWCGLALLEERAGAERASLVFWCLQLPIIKTPLFGYDFYTVLRGVLSVKLTPDELGELHLKFGVFADTGGNFSWSILRFDGEWKFAVNVVALAAIWLLMRSLRRKAPESTLTTS